MNLEILEIKELETGGAELIIDMDDTTQKYLVNYAIIELIKKGLLEVKELHETQIKEEAENEY
jgi:hypothetical protein